MATRAIKDFDAYTSAGEIDKDADMVGIWDDSAGVTKKVLVQDIPQPSLRRFSYTGNQVITRDELYAIHANEGATSDITLTFPAGQEGDIAVFEIDADYTITVSADGSEEIEDGTDLLLYDGVVVLSWLNDRWRVVGGDSLYDIS